MKRVVPFTVLDRRVRFVLLASIAFTLSILASVLWSRGVASSTASSPGLHAQDVLGTQRKALVMNAGTTEQIPSSDALLSPNGFVCSADDTHGGTLISVNPFLDPSAAVNGVWWTETLFNNAGPPYIDHDIQIGYNYIGAQRNDLTKAAQALEFESRYQLNNDPSPTQLVNETHLISVDTNDFQHRWISNATAWDGGFVDTSFQSSTMSWLELDGLTLLMQLTNASLQVNTAMGVSTDAVSAFQVRTITAPHTLFQINSTGNTMEHGLIVSNPVGGGAANLLTLAQLDAHPNVFEMDNNGHSFQMSQSQAGTLNLNTDQPLDVFYSVIAQFFGSAGIGISDINTGEWLTWIDLLKIKLARDNVIAWTTNATQANAALDTGLGRCGTGCVEANNGILVANGGTLVDVKTSTVSVNGTTKWSAAAVGAGPPGINCAIGDLFSNTTATTTTNALWVCTSLNTWTSK